MNKFKVGDWVRHPDYGVGTVRDAYEDGSLSLYFIVKGRQILLDTDEVGTKKEMDSMQKVVFDGGDFDGLFSEVEEATQIKVGDKVKTKRVIQQERFIIRKNAILTVKELHEGLMIHRQFMDAVYENNSVSIDVKLYFKDVELYEENEK